MKWGNNNKKIAAFIGLALFTITGSYNALVINSQSHLGHDAKFAKRLDEVFGVIKPGRDIAATNSWKKVSSAEMFEVKSPIIKVKEVATVTAKAVQSDTFEEAQASVQEELSLNLVEVANPKKWQKPLNSSQFGGSLKANNGVIESLDVSLPAGDGLSISFSEMTGNVFEYDHNGQIYSGMIYQVDQTSYMVSLTNGPLEGTRLRFAGEMNLDQVAQLEESHQYLAENHNVEVGSFGEEPSQQAMIQDDSMVEPAMQQAQAFNFDQKSSL